MKRFTELPPVMQTSAVLSYYEMLSKKRMTLFFKRGFDLICSSLGVILISPVLLICAILVKATSTGPVFYRQIRVGRYGCKFRIFKFRTMVVNADQLGAEITVGKRDPRITSVGFVLRKFRLDELPQLLNILTGDMSLIGARPEVPKYVACYTPEMLATLLLRPGISGIASVAFANENELLSDAEDPENYYIHTILPEKMRLNLQYIQRFSLINDLKIIVQTIRCVIKGK